MIGDPNPDEPDEFTFNCSINNYQNEPLLWAVRFEFSTSNTQEDPEEKNPLDRAVKIQVQRVQREQFQWQDKNGDAIVTAAGEFFEDVPTKSISGRRILFTKNYANNVEPSFLINLENKLNSAAVTIRGTSYAAKLLKFNMTNITYDLFENNVKHMKCEWELEYNPEGWDLNIMHRGYYELADDGGIVVPIKIPFTDSALTLLAAENPTRKVPSSPWPLNADGSAVRDPDLTPANFLTFEQYDTDDFTVIPGVT